MRGGRKPLLAQQTPSPTAQGGWCRPATKQAAFDTFNLALQAVLCKSRELQSAATECPHDPPERFSRLTAGHQDHFQIALAQGLCELELSGQREHSRLRRSELVLIDHNLQLDELP